MNNENKVHLWIGTNRMPEDAYLAYFAIDYSTEGDLESPDYRVCGFCKDIGRRWYDEDFIGIIPRRETPVPVEDLMIDAAVDAGEQEKVLAICAQKDINSANAIFWYQDATLVLPAPHAGDYNGLQYIGMFEGD